MSPGFTDPHMAAEAVTRAEHPTGPDYDVEPPRSWGWTQVITLVIVGVVVMACVGSLYTTP